MRMEAADGVTEEEEIVFVRRIFDYWCRWQGSSSKKKFATIAQMPCGWRKSSQIRDTITATSSWSKVPTTTSWLRQVRLCWLSPIRLTRAYCLCYSKLKLRSGCFLRGTNHICKSYVRTKGQSMMGCPFWVLIRPFDHPKISFPIPSKNYHSNPWLPV